MMKLIQILKNYQKQIFLGGFLVFALSALSLSITFAQNKIQVQGSGVDFTFDTVKQPVAVLKNNKVGLEFPIYLTNKSNTEKEVKVQLNCVKRASVSTYTQKPGQAKQTFIHPLSKEEVLFLNNLKKTKGKVPCEFSLISGGNSGATFDLYRNKIRIDIKNVKKHS